MHQEPLEQPPHQQIIIIQQPATVTRAKDLTHAVIPSFPRCLAVTLGIVQLLLGLISWFAASVAIVFLAYNYEIGYGFWCGLFFFVSAGVSIHAGRRPTRSAMKQLIVWSVISFIFAGIELGFSIDGLVINLNYPYTSTAYVCWWWCWWTTVCYYNYTVMEFANGLMIGVAGLELFICLRLIFDSAHSLKQANLPVAVANATVVDLHSGPSHEGPHNPVTVTVVETPAQPQHLQPQNVTTNEFGPPPKYDVDSPPPYVK